MNNNKIQLYQESLFDDNKVSNRKNIFLNNLKSKECFKRYAKSPIRYGGGKSLAVGTIISNIPDDIKKIISPFLGGGSLEIALAQELNIEVVAYDIFDLLVNYWQIQIEKPEELYKELIKLKNTKEEYENVKNILKSVWNKKDGLNNNILSKIELAAYYYFNHNLSYGPGFLGWMSSIYLNENKYLSMLNKVKNFNVSNIKVYNESFDYSIPKHKNDFLYLDPPYFLEGDSKMFKGIYPMRNFPIHHNNFNHKLLSELLNEHKGGFILSYNDCSWIRENYKKFEFKEVSWQYTMGQGEKRVGKNRLKRNFDNGNVKTSHEILIIGKKT